MRLNRRHFLQTTGATGLLLAAAPTLALKNFPPRIDRRALIRRHNPVFTQFDPFSALSVGNGEFAFTADVTGLQTFAGECAAKFPLCTISHWAWHSTPLPAGLDPKNFRYTDFDTYGRLVGYPTDPTGQEALYNWMRENPHRFHLGQIALELEKSDGTSAVPGDLKSVRQTLDLWSSLLDSGFEFAGQPVPGPDELPPGNGFDRRAHRFTIARKWPNAGAPGVSLRLAGNEHGRLESSRMAHHHLFASGKESRRLRSQTGRD